MFELDTLLDRYGWFAGINEDEYGRIVVCVNDMRKPVSDIVPDTLYGYQIIMVFESHYECGDKYGVVHLDLGTGESWKEIEGFANY